MKRFIVGLAAFAAAGSAFATTYYTDADLLAPMTREQVAALSPADLERRGQLLDLAISQARVNLQKANCSFGRSAFKPLSQYDDSGC